MTHTAIVTLLPELMAWLNQNLPIDPKKPLVESDIAHIGLMPAEFAAIRAQEQRCPWRKVLFKQYIGVEFWQTAHKLPDVKTVGDLRGRIAWRPTSNTAALFKKALQAGKNAGKDLD
ncbi:hypothetical protein QZN30_05445 [Burkholderia multivorans]|jgi:hypothetical protein|nr:hypothetical protein [Burkholderia multivorans]